MCLARTAEAVGTVVPSAAAPDGGFAPPGAGSSNEPASVTDVLLAQMHTQYAVLLEVARRRAVDLPGLLPALQHDTVVLGTSGPPQQMLGWFVPSAWRYRGRTVHELAVSIESRALDGHQRHAEAVLVVLLHEAAHLYAWTLGIRDTTRVGRHNDRFAAIAGVMGLTVVPNPDAGVVTPTIAGWARPEYADLLDTLDGAVVLVRRSGVGPGAAAPGCRCQRPAGRWRPALRRLYTRRWIRRIDAPTAPDRLGFVICPTGKRGYPDEASAVAALRAIRRRAEPDRNKGCTESAAYPCQLCDGWHLTSGPQTRRHNRAPRSRSRR